MSASADIQISPVSSPTDFVGIFACQASSFGDQINDAIWMALNPNYKSPLGQKAGISKIVKRWQTTTTNKQGQPNTVFLKATLPDGESGRRIVGFAIWVQCSAVDGYGYPPSESLGDDIADLELSEQRFVSQMFKSMHKRRIEVVKQKMSADPPAVFALDMCAVDPAFQGRGVAGKLVEWGLEEAKRRGGLEATTEASSMGRGVYARCGFRPEGGDIEYDVDEEFRTRKLPPNIFMRTRGV